MEKFHCNLSDEIDQDDRTTATHLRTLLQLILTEGMIAPLLITMWDHMDGCANQYRCESAINLLSCLALDFSIIIIRVVRIPVNRKDVVDGLNGRNKWMIKSATTNLLNPELIRDEPIVFKFM